MPRKYQLRISQRDRRPFAPTFRAFRDLAGRLSAAQPCPDAERTSIAGHGEVRRRMNADYWSWWTGGGALALVAAGYWLCHRRPLGVSGMVARCLPGFGGDGGSSGEGSGSVCAPHADPACGEPPGCGIPISCGGVEDGKGAVNEAGAHGDVPAREGALPGFLFLVGMAVGGGLSVLVTGRSWGTLEYSRYFAAVFGEGWRSLAVLGLGGFLVGLGTRLSGGCTSGHGLSGCGRLRRTSLVATGVFFGVAIGAALILGRFR